MNSKLSHYVKSKFVRLAQDLMENPQGLKFKLEKASEKLAKASVVDSLGAYVEELKTLIRLSLAWVTRKYTKVNTQTILYTIVAVIYFVTPTDFVPDFLIGLGFVDDIGVLTWVLSLIKDDLDKFKDWERKKTTKKPKQIKTKINNNLKMERNIS